MTGVEAHYWKLVVLSSVNAALAIASPASVWMRILSGALCVVCAIGAWCFYKDLPKK